MHGNQVIAPICCAQVAESGLDFVIVRTAKTEAGEPSLAEAGVSVTPQGSLTGSSKVTRSQVGFKSPLSNAFVLLCEFVLLLHTRTRCSCLQAPANWNPQNKISVVAYMPVQPDFCCHA